MPAIAPHSSATTDGKWEAGSNERRIKTPVTQSVAAGFWTWREAGKSWPDTKSGYKLPHHEVDGEGNPGAANLRACSGVISVLNGGRGGVEIPDGDRQGVYDHVARHLKAGGRTPPPLGASVQETEAWCAALELELDETADKPAEPANGQGSLDSPAKTVVEPGVMEIDLLAPLVPLGHSAWAILPAALNRVLRARSARLSSSVDFDQIKPAAVSRRVKAAPITMGDVVPTTNTVAVINLSGVITPRGSLLSILFGLGGGGLEGFREAFREALNNPEVGAIVINVDSPGGLVSLVPETANEILEARGAKPIVAVANTIAASAAYWLASAADELVITPSGQVGSIGVYVLHEDVSAMAAMQGVALTFVQAGQYKTEGNPYEPLGETAQEAIQGQINEIYGDFVSGVAAGRGVSTDEVEANYGQGRMMRAEPAVAAGLADRVATIDEVICGLLGATPSSSGGASAALTDGLDPQAAADDPEVPEGSRRIAAIADEVNSKREAEFLFG